MRRRSRCPGRRRIVVTLDELEALALKLADADAEDDAAYRRARRRLWKAFRKAVEARAEAMARKVLGRKAVG